MPIDRVEINPFSFNLEGKVTEVPKGYKEDLLFIGEVEVVDDDTLLIGDRCHRDAAIERIRYGIIRGFPPRIVHFNWRFDPLSRYDNPVGIVPIIPIGQATHKDQSPADIAAIEQVAAEVGSEVTPRPNGFYDSTVVKHRGWLWAGTAIGIGATALGLVTAFSLEHHKRKHKK